MKSRFSLFFLLSVFAIAAHASSATENLSVKGHIMLDVSRHFMPMEKLYKQVDAMAYYKILVLHLHITDAAGWRLEIKRYPRLTEYAAWRTAERWMEWWNDGKRRYVDIKKDSAHAHGGFYTQDEMRALVKYAAERGVTIMPEIEFPAHSEEVLAAYPELCCTGKPYTCADFCIGADASYEFIRNVLEEVVSIFPSEYIHMGGDEAGGLHWKTCPRCKDMKQIEAMRKVNAIVQSFGRKMVCWDEVLTDDPADSSIVIMVWRNVEQIEKAARLGHDVILCPSRYCYLDQYQDAPPYQPRAMGGYLPLRDVYEYIASLKKMGAGARNEVTGTYGRALGVSLNLWTEYVEDPDWAECMLWPRCLALTLLNHESARYDNSYDTFREWVEQQGAWFLQHGINAYDIHEEYGERPEMRDTIEALSVGKRITYQQPYHEYYPASGKHALNDGLQGGWRNTDGRWQGFLSPFDVVLDLGKKMPVNEIAITFMQCRGPEIFLPSEVVFEISNNGKTWESIYTMVMEDNQRPVTFETFRWTKEEKRFQNSSKNGIKARYVRCQATQNIHGGWLFTDELIVR